MGQLETYVYVWCRNMTFNTAGTRNDCHT